MKPSPLRREWNELVPLGGEGPSEGGDEVFIKGGPIQWEALRIKSVIRKRRSRQM